MIKYYFYWKQGITRIFENEYIPAFSKPSFISEAYETLQICSFMNAAFYLFRGLLKENQ